MSKFCASCGSPLKENARFCQKCGAEIKQLNFESKPSNDNFDTSSKHKKSKTISIIVASVVVAAIIAVLCYLFIPKLIDSTSDEPNYQRSDKAVGEINTKIEFVSADFSNYPTIRLYYRITDSATGNVCKTLPASIFSIKEVVEGSTFERGAISSDIIDQTEGLDISFVVDKSASISKSSMEQIKSVMKQFVTTLQYAAGDQAEVLSFDTIVRQMCSFTQNTTWINNGIDNMFPEGETALYDALKTGVTHAANQSHMPCVIAFTDGQDNRSTTTVSEIIKYAKDNWVPIFIVGVGNKIDEVDLRRIANETGGKYWNINDLSGLSEIYNTVYKSEKELFSITYETDSSLDKYAARTIEILLNGSCDIFGNSSLYNVSGQSTCSISPNQITDPTKTQHTSRYELVRSDVSWEEAKRLCEEKGGHLVTITDEAEMQTIVDMASAEGMKGVWIGGYTSYNAYGQVFGHWITGEQFDFAKWSTGEPSRYDKTDKAEEYYIMLWDVPDLGGWTLNDQRNDPVAAGYWKGEIGYVIEWEN